MTCDVCPRECKLTEGAWGFCDVRAAHRDSVSDMYYSAIAWPGVRIRFGPEIPFAFNALKKKPVAEVYVPGCNFKCDFCVGPFLSRLGDIRGIRWIPPDELVSSVAGMVDVLMFSGGEPSIHAEYLTEVFSKCRDRGIFTGLESNGFMTKGTAEKLARVTNCIGIGLKASLDSVFYRQKFGVETESILEAAKVFEESGSDVMLTNLTDPNLWEDNEAFENVTDWIVRNMKPDTRLILAPLETTARIPVTSKEQREAHLQGYQKLAREKGLQQVHLQLDVQKASEEHQQYLEKIGYFRTLEKLGIGISAY